MNRVNENSGNNFGTILKIIATLSAILAIICFVTPSVRKSGALRDVGETTMTEMRAATTAISYYSAQGIDALVNEPAVNSGYKFLAGLLSQLNTQQGYQKSYLLYRDEDKTLRCLVDGSYRDNAEAGTDYFLPGEEYLVSGEYKPVKSIVDKIYSGKSTSGYTTELVTRQDFKQVVVTCLPVYGSAHAVVAVLCIENDPGNTAYHMVGTVNLYYAGLILAGVFGVCVILLMIRKKYLRHKQEKLVQQQLREQEAEQAAQQAEQQQPESSGDAADAKTSAPPADGGSDDEQTPGDNIDTLQ